MAKLKTYVTSMGFFEMAVAAPSMKAAIKAWGASPNVFSKGFAKETNEKAVVAATTEQAGVIFYRPVGSKSQFIRYAKLPDFGAMAGGKKKKSIKANARPIAQSKKSGATEKKTAEIRRHTEAQAIAQQKKAVAAQKRVTAEYDRVQQAHLAILERINKAQDGLDKQRASEEVRWQKKKKALENESRNL